MVANRYPETKARHLEILGTVPSSRLIPGPSRTSVPSGHLSSLGLVLVVLPSRAGRFGVGLQDPSQKAQAGTDRPYVDVLLREGDLDASFPKLAIDGNVKVVDDLEPVLHVGEETPQNVV